MKKKQIKFTQIDKNSVNNSFSFNSEDDILIKSNKSIINTNISPSLDSKIMRLKLNIEKKINKLNNELTKKINIFETKYDNLNS